MRETKVIADVSVRNYDRRALLSHPCFRITRGGRLKLAPTPFAMCSKQNELIAPAADRTCGAGATRGSAADPGGRCSRCRRSCVRAQPSSGWIERAT
jgi:hypothetical protein